MTAPEGDEVDRDTRILELAKAGATPRNIGDLVGSSPEEVLDELAGILRRKHPGRPPELALEMERLDQINSSVWRAMVRGDDKAAKTALAVHETRKKVERDYDERMAARTPAASLQDSMNDLVRRTAERNGGADWRDTPSEPTTEE